MQQVKTFPLSNGKLDISKAKTIQDLQQDFSNHYPFLKLEFYKTTDVRPSVHMKERIPQSTTLRSAGLTNTGMMEINDDMTVEELERIFLEQFGLVVQVSRNAGGIWLETTMTDKWSLHKQNEYGREIVHKRF